MKNAILITLALLVIAGTAFAVVRKKSTGTTLPAGTQSTSKSALFPSSANIAQIIKQSLEAVRAANTQPASDSGNLSTQLTYTQKTYEKFLGA